MQEFEELKTLVAEIEDDLNKAGSGNKAAGTRVRKQMQLFFFQDQITLFQDFKHCFFQQP